MLRLPLLLFIGAATIVGGGCAASQALGVGAMWSEDRAEIEEAIQKSADAWNRGDLPGHLSFYADSVTFMTSTGPRVGKSSLEASFSTAYFSGGRPRQSLRFEQLSVSPIGRDGALATGRFILSGGGEPDQAGWFTLVWERTPAGWRAVHDHSS